MGACRQGKAGKCFPAFVSLSLSLSLSGFFESGVRLAGPSDIPVNMASATRYVIDVARHKAERSRVVSIPCFSSRGWCFVPVLRGWGGGGSGPGQGLSHVGQWHGVGLSLGAVRTSRGRKGWVRNVPWDSSGAEAVAVHRVLFPSFFEMPVAK